MLRPHELLGLQYGSWEAYDAEHAVRHFGEHVEREIKLRLDDYLERIRQTNEQNAGVQGGPKPTRPDEEYMRDLAVETWYYWVKKLVRVKVGIAEAKDTSARGDGGLARIIGYQYLVKPAVYDPDIDLDLGTDDIEVVVE